MSLRTKIILMSTAGLLLTGAILLPLLVVITSNSIEELEHQSAHKDIELFAGAMSTAGQDLATTAESWGAWDDTYVAVTDPEKFDAFIEANVSPETLAPIRVDLMAYVDYATPVTPYIYLSPDTGQAAPLASDFAQSLGALGLLDERDPTQGTRALAIIGGAPMILAVQPVTTNDFSAAAPGALIFGRRMNAKEIAQITEAHDLNVSITQQPLESDHYDLLSFDLGVIKHTDSIEGTVLTSMLLLDPRAQEVLALEMSSPREVYALAKRTLWLLTGTLVVVGLITLITSLIALNRTVLSRLTRLAYDVELIAAASNPSERITVAGNDELSGLGSSVNTMLESLEKTQARLERANIENLTYAIQLEQSVEALKEADSAKDRFLAGMSHELRTPLNAIIGFSGLLEKGVAGDLNPEQRTQIGMIHSAGQHQLQLINDLLDLAKIRAGRIRLKSAAFSLNDLLRETAHLCEPLVAPEVLLILEESRKDVKLISDRARLLQVLLNLTGNAAKFTTLGSITIATRLHNDCVTISITDTGIGIPSEDLARVLEEFAQVDSPSRSANKGTGLGLAISRQLTELLGGTLSMRSEIGQGTVSEIELPLAPLATDDASD